MRGVYCTFGVFLLQYSPLVFMIYVNYNCINMNNQAAIHPLAIILSMAIAALVSIAGLGQ